MRNGLSRSANLPRPRVSSSSDAESGGRARERRRGQLLPGDVIDGRYDVECTAGRGGMGVVYRARDLLTGGRVAVKVLEGGRPERFEREIAILSELSHPAIVRYIGHGTTDERAYLAMEWLKGDSLARRLRGPGVTVGETVHLGIVVAEALGVGHAHGIVHRDVKPSNLVFEAREGGPRVKVLDFGLAHRMQGEALTRPGAMVGTPGYLSPEQARGSERVDPRADVFSLGCVLFECLTGVSLFAGGHPAALLARLLFEDAKRVRDLRPELPEPLSAIVERMLKRDADERFADGREVAKALSELDLNTTASHVVNTAARRAVLTRREVAPISVIHIDGASRYDKQVREAIAGEAQSFGASCELREDGSSLIVVTAAVATDQAVRAARLALRLASIDREGSIVITTGMGHTDEAVTRGEAVVRARLLPHLTRTILLDETTARLLPPRFATRAPSQRTTGEEETTVELYGERRLDPAPRIVAGRRTPCIGRDRDLRMLEGLIDAASSDCAATAILVTGPPGIGKSRLRHSLLERLEKRGEPFAVWTGRADPLRSGSAYGVVGFALRRLFKFTKADDAIERRRKVYERVLESISYDETPRVARLLAELAGVPTREHTDVRHLPRRSRDAHEEELREAFVEFLAAEALQRPVLFLVEDMQFCDLASMRLLTHALRRLPESPVVVLGFARPDVHALFPRLFDECALSELRLSPLAQTPAAELVRYVLGSSAKDADVDRMVRLSNGVPRMLEALIEDASQAAEASSGAVMALAHARFAELDVEARQILRAASLIDAITPRAVGLLLGAAIAPATISRWLERLEGKQLLARKGSGEELLISDPLLRDAARATLTDSDRKFGAEVADSARRRERNAVPASKAPPPPPPIPAASTQVRARPIEMEDDTVEDPPMIVSGDVG